MKHDSVEIKEEQFWFWAILTNLFVISFDIYCIFSNI